MQFIIMTVSIHTQLNMVSDGRFEAMWVENVTVNFFQISIMTKIFDRTKYESFRKIELKENFVISV